MFDNSIFLFCLKNFTLKILLDLQNLGGKSSYLSFPHLFTQWIKTDSAFVFHVTWEIPVHGTLFISLSYPGDLQRKL